ncbi:MAG: Coenzyme F420 hydrogenase/dehydrogenase, beta subunit C-terminal domain [Acidimicrobiia bacterium]|nr:Coenzyme F420 hydrogenase/dehydrogenase, beta subunit C-terminal domain [Acidimicrobiia bacterium]
MGEHKDLGPVIESGMCIGCGACAVADSSVELVLDPDRLAFAPSSPGGVAAASVCPALEVDFEGLQEWRFPGAYRTRHGVVDSVHLAQSTDRDRNVKASSGGLIKELMLHYLERGDVDGIIALDHVAGLDFRPTLVTDADHVDRLPGSVYHNLAQPEALELLRRHDGRFVLVGIPCQLEGLFSYVRRIEPRLAERIHATIGLLCGWQYNHHALRAICRYKGIDFEAITDISYRGGGPVGRLRIVTPTREHRIHRRLDFSYQVAFDRSFNLPRCHLCVDHANFLADVVVGDAWLPSTVTTRTGVSLVICRTPEATATIEQMARRGRLQAAEASVDDVTESQTRSNAFGDFAYAYAEYLEEIGEHRPRMVGPNRTAARLSPRREVEAFHREVLRKRELQGQGRYRRLWWRKATADLWPLARRYLRWFFVRVLRVKSLTGRRREIGREKTQVFR